MTKLDKRLKYHSDDDKPVTISLRLPRELHARLEQYATQHRQSISELMRDGLEWRLSEGDPRGLGAGGSSSSPQADYGNREGDMLAEIRADNERVLQEVLHGFAQQESQIESLLRVLEQQLPLGSNGAYSSNTAIQPGEQAHTTEQEPASDTASMDTMPPMPATVLQAAQNPALVEDMRGPSADVSAYDTTRYRLGKLCPRNHDYHGTGQSLRMNNKSGGCRACDVEQKRERRQAKRQEVSA
jgi:hypothetical protein